MKSAIYYQKVDSTNLAAWRLIDQTPRSELAHLEGTVIWAEEQTAGKGQWGKCWQSQPGGLYLSRIVFVNIPADRAGQITLWSAWGIATVLRLHLPNLCLKWPNDLVIDRYKLGGILTETRLHNGRVYVAVIGVGINGWNVLPATAIGIKDLCSNITSVQMLLSLVNQGIELGKNRSEQEGMNGIVQEYRSLLDRKHIQHEGKTGTIIKILGSGALCIAWQDGTHQTFLPGTISLGYL